MTWLAEALLHALAEAPAERTVADLAAHLGRDRVAVDKSLVVLLRRELIERPAPGIYRIAAAGHALLATGGAVRAGAPGHPRRAKAQPTVLRHLRHRLWTALGHRRKATLPELLLLTCQGNERAAEHNARRYLRLLERTGYLIRLPARASGVALTSPGHIKWLVVRWTGPHAPVARARFTAVYDPNHGKTVTVEAQP